MRVAYVEIRSDNDKPVDAEIRVESEIANTGQFSIDASYPVTSGEPDAKRTIPLLAGQRVIIAPRGPDVEMVYDRDQNAAMPREAHESQPTDAEKAKTEEDRQNELRGGVRADAKIQREANAAADQARDKVIADQQEKSREAAAASNERQKTQNPGSDAPNKAPSPATGTPQGSPQSPAASRQSPPTGASTTEGKGGGMTAPGPSTGGQSSKDVK
jgi:hypothetical protein